MLQFLYFIHCLKFFKRHNARKYRIYCMKSVQIRSFIWFVFSSIQSRYRKIRTRENSVFGHFSHCNRWANKCTSPIQKRHFDLYLMVKLYHVKKNKSKQWRQSFEKFCNPFMTEIQII